MAELSSGALGNLLLLRMSLGMAGQLEGDFGEKFFTGRAVRVWHSCPEKLKGTQR